MTIVYRLYLVTFAVAVRFANGESFNAGDTRKIRASSLRMAGSQSTRTDGSDIRSIELLAVDNPHATGKQARTVARLSGVSTRHMLAAPARMVARHVLTPSTNLRITAVSDRAVTFHVGGAY